MHIFTGFFIDDDLLYEDLLGSTEDEEPLVDDDDDSESSWGSEEFDEYSEDSGDERIVSSYIENGDHSPRGPIDRQHGSTAHRSMVTSYGVERQGGKEEKQVIFVKLLCSVSYLREINSSNRMNGHFGLIQN